MATTEFAVVWTAANAGSLPSITRNVNLWQSTVLCIFTLTKARQTATYTKQLRSQDTVRGSARGLCEWPSMLEIALERKLVRMLTPGGTPSPV